MQNVELRTIKERLTDAYVRGFRAAIASAGTWGSPLQGPAIDTAYEQGWQHGLTVLGQAKNLARKHARAQVIVASCLMKEVSSE